MEFDRRKQKCERNNTPMGETSARRNFVPGAWGDVLHREPVAPAMAASAGAEKLRGVMPCRTDTYARHGALEGCSKDDRMQPRQ